MTPASVRIVCVSMLAGATACATPPPAPPPAPVATSIVRIHRKAALEPLARPEAVLVQDLDRGIQARFRDVRPSDIAAGRLGASRVGRLDVTPRGLLHKELKDEHQAIRDLSAAGWDSAIYVVEGVDRGTRTGSIVGPIVSREEMWSRFGESDGIRELATRALVSRAPERGRASGVSLEARPVLASEASCLRCHRRSEIGDPLGAVVYAFRTRPLLSDAGR